MSAVAAANLALKFLLELVAVAAFAMWGASVADGVLSVLAAVAAAAACVALWGRFAAPKSAHRLGDAARVPFELGVFVLAAIGLLDTAGAPAAAIFAGLVIVNAVGLTVLRQWEQ